MSKRIRNIPLHVRVTAKELEAIQQGMEESRIINRSAFIRRMALKGYVLHVDLSPVKELISLLRRCFNNLNQIAAHANTYSVYQREIAGLQRDYNALWEKVNKMLQELVALIEL